MDRPAPHAALGKRLKTRRLAAGLTLAELAGLSAVSAPYLSRVERGLRTMERRSIVSRVATALGCTPADLWGDFGTPMEDRDRLTNLVPAIRAAILDAGMEDVRINKALPISALQRQSAAIWETRRAADTRATLRLLPTHIRDAAAHVRSGQDPQSAQLLLVRALSTVAFQLRSIGAVDLRMVASQLCEAHAATSGDPTAVAFSAYTKAHVAAAGSGYRSAALIAAMAADQLRARANSEAALRVYGNLLLTAGFSFAVQGNLSERDRFVSEAEEVATRVGACPMVGDEWQTYFGPTNVEIWRTCIAAEIGDIDSALFAASGVNPALIGSRSRLGAFYSELGTALAHGGRRYEQQAIGLLRKAEKVAPIRVRNDERVRAAVATMLDSARRRSLREDLHSLARRMGSAG